MIDTVDTTRLNSSDPYTLAVMVSRLIYPDNSVPWRPKAVILASTAYFHAAMAASSLVHFPIDAPVLLTHPWMLPPATREEILRLQPTGAGLPAQVWIIGPVAPGIIREIQNMGFTVLAVTAENPFKLAARVADLRRDVSPVSETGRQNVILISGEDFSGGLAAPAYAAHAGVPVLFFLKNGLPEPTQNALTKMQDSNVYILATDTVVTPEVTGRSNRLLKEKSGISAEPILIQWPLTWPDSGTLWIPLAGAAPNRAEVMPFPSLRCAGGLMRRWAASWLI